MNRYRLTQLAMHPILPDVDGDWVHYEEAKRLHDAAVYLIGRNLRMYEGRDFTVAEALALQMLEAAMREQKAPETAPWDTKSGD